MNFPEKFDVKVKDGKVRVSVKINDETIIIKECTVQEFEQMIAKYRAEKAKNC